MLKSSIHQVIGSAGSAILNLLIVVFTARILGAEGRGEITLLFAFSGLLQIVTAIIGSSVMVFMLTKQKEGPVLIASFLWTTATVLIASVVFYILNILDHKLLPYLFLITIVQSLFNNLLGFYTAKIRFLAIGVLRILQPLILVVGLGVTYTFTTLTVTNYWQLLIVSFMPSLVLICWETYKYGKHQFNILQIKVVSFHFLKLGGLNQLNNLMQYGSYRFAVWSISSQLGIKEVGVFGLWLTVCDAIWLIPVALASVNQGYAAKYNYVIGSVNKYLAIAIAFSAVVVMAAVIFPIAWYTAVLGKDFFMLKSLIILSSPVLILFSISIVYAYYFSAKGLIKYNTISSGLGLIAILVSTHYLTSIFGIKGAVIANCISYSISTAATLFLFLRFQRQLKTRTINSKSL